MSTNQRTWALLVLVLVLLALAAFAPEIQVRAALAGVACGELWAVLVWRHHAFGAWVLAQEAKQQKAELEAIAETMRRELDEARELRNAALHVKQ